jgi:hypothetical protein
MRRRLPIPASPEFDRFTQETQFRDRIAVVVKRAIGRKGCGVIRNSEGRRVATGEEPCL